MCFRVIDIILSRNPTLIATTKVGVEASKIGCFRSACLRASVRIQEITALNIEYPL